MAVLKKYKRHLHPGKVYRRQDLEKWFPAVDRSLQLLVKDGTLEKLSPGMYYVPRQSVFGKTPPEEQELVKGFLKDDRFLLTSPNDYNMLGVGTTQLYNTSRVYNHKRHGEFKLGNRTFQFLRKSYFPEKVSKEFLLVDLVNNLKTLTEEDQPALLKKVKLKALEMDTRKLKHLADNFGLVRTKKLFKDILPS
ncbi:MAG TPA: hypothetical protein PLL71_04210 [Agriterribacter sp.]|nr:hypothetical protein [Agriterribacter sp.]HRQ51023.1 hypothetical protein [Agriterribacter sp.]